MLRHYIYWALGASSLGLLLFAAPSGALLVRSPGRGKVVRDAAGRSTVPTVRSRRTSTFIFFGGGFHGGK